jgi:hypothetical protein
MTDLHRRSSWCSQAWALLLSVVLHPSYYSQTHTSVIKNFIINFQLE